MRIEFINKAKRKCRQCGKEFTPTCPMNAYCSKKCAAESKNETALQFYYLNKKKINAKIKEKRHLTKRGLTNML